MVLFRALTALVAAAFLSSCIASSPAPTARAPVQQATDGFVIAANPLAAEAGAQILRRGGSAIDAAIAVQAMLSLVEPQSSGVGGGAFMNFYDGRTRKITIYD